MTDLIQTYTVRFNAELKPAAELLANYLEETFVDSDVVCFRKTRAKSIDRFVQKSERTNGGVLTYDDPLNQIQDQIGGLIVTRFLSDVELLKKVVADSFTGIETQRHEPESEFEFGYIGEHFILFLPLEVISEIPDYSGPDFFELQIKTLFQYAWSETNHAIGYEKQEQLSREQKRMTAYIAAQAWGADKATDELNSALTEESQSNAKLHQRGN